MLKDLGYNADIKGGIRASRKHLPNYSRVKGLHVKTDNLKVPKKLQSVTLWVHPEGRVSGALYLREHSPHHAGSEEPLEVLNQGEHFLVFRRELPEEIRFYNLRSVIRMEYDGAQELPVEQVTVLPCRLLMMDGSLIEGTIQEALPADRARLLDYLNRKEDSFIKLHMEEGIIYLINKSYINHVHVPGITHSDD